MSPTASAKATRNTEVWTAVGVLFVLALLIVPLPGLLVDLFLALSLGAAIIVLLVALQSTRPLDFSSFPTVLLLLTLFRLAMNVSSTRLILSGGHAGEIIPAFGEFVIGGNYVVGLILFLILVAINFIVITKGAGRVAEVSARFTLDALPGKQMAIDGELAHGAIDAMEARQRREMVGREADFFGAMDGASRFRTYWNVAMPLSRPALITLAIIQFQGSWNDFLGPLLYLRDAKLLTLTVGLNFFKTQYAVEWNKILVGSMFNAIPILIIFFIFNKYYMEGASYSGLAGQ